MGQMKEVTEEDFERVVQKQEEKHSNMQVKISAL
jgi:hypothetical protein